MKKGDIVLIPFPFTDLKGSKNRPAIVLFSNDYDLTLCFITTSLQWFEKFDVLIEPNKLNGLKIKSLIRINKIATIDKDLALGKLGELSFLECQQLNSNLKKVLQLD